MDGTWGEVPQLLVNMALFSQNQIRAVCSSGLVSVGFCFLFPTSSCLEGVPGCWCAGTSKLDFNLSLWLLLCGIEHLWKTGCSSGYCRLWQAQGGCQQTVGNFFFLFFLLVNSFSKKHRGRISVWGTDLCVNSTIAAQGNVCFANIASVI